MRKIESILYHDFEKLQIYFFQIWQIKYTVLLYDSYCHDLRQYLIITLKTILSYKKTVTVIIYDS